MPTWIINYSLTPPFFLSPKGLSLSIFYAQTKPLESIFNFYNQTGHLLKWVNKIYLPQLKLWWIKLSNYLPGWNYKSLLSLYNAPSSLYVLSPPFRYTVPTRGPYHPLWERLIQTTKEMYYLYVHICLLWPQ